MQEPYGKGSRKSILTSNLAGFTLRTADKILINA
jgi:hypothetical protein